MFHNKYDLTYDDYAQSANTLFHFMKKPEYLKNILLEKAIVPRYCKEDLEYLNIKAGDEKFVEAFVLQKCFCDIPFHKLVEAFTAMPVGDNYDRLSDKEKSRVPEKYTHSDFYGEYAIAFSKKWGETNNLQPIHYLNECSQYSADLSEVINQTLNLEDVPDIFSDDILNRICFIKPLRGIMKRNHKTSEGVEIEIEFQKNFHDEQEWRYVPTIEDAVSVDKETVIANIHMLEMNGKGIDVNKELTETKCSPLWLRYSYEDIRYIIVPNVNARVDLINTIISIPNKMFDHESDIEMQKYILISKVIVLEEIRKDL